MKKIISLGKVDFNGSGRRVNEVTIEVRLTNDGELDMTGTIWNAKHTDVVICGQIGTDIAKLFPDDPKAQRIVEVWKRWHLNHMRAGTPTQNEYLRNNPVTYKHPQSSYEAACWALKSVNLYVDDGYRYGTAWLKEDLPSGIIEEVNGW